MTELMPTLNAASAAAFGLALSSAVAGFGGGVLLLPVFTVLFGLRAAVPMLTLTQLVGNGSRVWCNRRDLRRRRVDWFAGAAPARGARRLHVVVAPLKDVAALSSSSRLRGLRAFACRAGSVVVTLVLMRRPWQ
ncbi:MAG TPA: hypothetical protein VJT49_26355 [Amycolatopsis sp.]|uniref:hypothetical protein n=1 Tax=Amycolatopsis sp. TaxID=37632 RepID=UPI002B48BF43|nr:hypothetical protein [Amycolatopsis sp.]HKS48570.1 hypothetical protein [Amycolatopsis sp.]